MIDRQQAQQFVEDLADAYGFAVLKPDDVGVVAMREALRVAGALIPVPVVGQVLDGLLERADHTSVTVPAVDVILLSPHAVASAVEYAAVGAHECAHASQIDRTGDGQSIVDYLLSAELRAQREAEACAVEAFVRALLTGEVPSVDAIVDGLRSGYHLDAAHIELARGILRSHAETIRAGVVPPIKAAVDALAMLRRVAPDAIVAEGWR